MISSRSNIGPQRGQESRWRFLTRHVRSANTYFQQAPSVYLKYFKCMEGGIHVLDTENSILLSVTFSPQSGAKAEITPVLGVQGKFSPLHTV
jgi:hypothetical protein